MREVVTQATGSSHKATCRVEWKIRPGEAIWRVEGGEDYWKSRFEAALVSEAREAVKRAIAAVEQEYQRHEREQDMIDPLRQVKKRCAKCPD